MEPLEIAEHIFFTLCVASFTLMLRSSLGFEKMSHVPPATLSHGIAAVPEEVNLPCFSKGLVSTDPVTVCNFSFPTVLGPYETFHHHYLP